MKLLSFVFIIASLSSALSGEAVEALSQIRLKGYLGDRLDAMLMHQVVRVDVDYITACFQEKTERKGWWQTEFWGKYMHAAVPYVSYCGSETLMKAIDRGVDRVLASQEPCGYIGNYPDDLRLGEGWDVWGIKYTMMGLLHYYDWIKGSGADEKRSSRVLSACRRLCDYVIKEIGPGGKRGRELWTTGNWSGYASSSILEPVVWLYRRTGEKRYLDFAESIVRGMTEPESGPRLLDLAMTGISVADRNGYGNVPDPRGGYVMKHNRWKAYEMMSCYQGLVDYAQETGRRDLIEAAIRTGDDIAKIEVNLAGGCASSEAWFHGADKQHLPYARLQETCVTTTWMRFCEKLLEVTDDPKWVDRIEQAFYNAYLGALKSDGTRFAMYTPLAGDRYQGQHHCFMHTDCCTANGPRGFLCFLRKCCTQTDKTVTFNFYTTARVPGFDMYSLYPRNESVRIVSHTNGFVNVRLRVPAWSESTKISVNGCVQEGVRAGAYFALAREWRLGDIIEVVLDMPVVAHVRNRHVAFTRGPILLARDSRFGDGDLMEPFRQGTVVDGGRVESFHSVRTPSDDMWMAFSSCLLVGGHAENPEARNPVSVSFCDFASAGNIWQRGNYYRTWFPVECWPEL